MNVKLRYYDSSKDLKNHTNHHIGTPNNGENKNFVIQVNDLKEDDKAKCIEELESRGFTTDNALKAYVFNKNVIANEVGGDFYEKKLKTSCENSKKGNKENSKEGNKENFENLIPILLLNRCIYHSYFNSDTSIKIRQIGNGTKDDEIDDNKAKQEIANGNNILLSFELIDKSEEFSTLICFRYNQEDNSLILTTFYPKEIETQLLKELNIKNLFRRNFDSLFQDYISAPSYLQKFIKYLKTTNLTCFKELNSDNGDVKNFCTVLKARYEFMENEFNKNKNDSYIAQNQKKLLETIDARKSSLTNDQRISEALRNEILNKLNTIEDICKKLCDENANEDDIKKSVNLVFLYSLLEACKIIPF